MPQPQIFLIGSMGSGKSYTAQQWAALSGFQYVDLDDLVEQLAGKSIPNIFAQDGEAAFRVLEKNALVSLPDIPLIIACGGGTPCFFDNISWMKTRGLVIYLKAEVDILCQRLKADTTGRPLLQAGDLRSKIQTLLHQRQDCYQQAHFVFQQQSTTDTVAEKLHAYFKLELRLAQ